MLIDPKQTHIKFKKLFPSLKGVKMGMCDLKFCIRLYNIFRRAKIITLKKLLNFSINKLAKNGIGKGIDGFYNAVLTTLSQLNQQHSGFKFIGVLR